MTRRLVIAVVVGGGLLAAPAAAHTTSDGFVTLAVHRTTLTGTVDLAVRDLHDAIGLDPDGDGAIAWRDVVARRDAITGYVADRLALATPAGACPIAFGTLGAIDRVDGKHVAVAITARCSETPETVDIAYRAMFDLDAHHRGLVAIGGTRTVVRDGATVRLAVRAGTGGTPWWLGIGGIAAIAIATFAVVGLRRRRRLAVAACVAAAACGNDPGAAPPPPTPSVASAVAPAQAAPAAVTSPRGSDPVSKIFVQLEHEAAHRPAVEPSVETVMKHLAATEFAVVQPKQYVALTVGARYCVGGTNRDGIAVAVCEYASHDDAVRGRTATMKHFDALNDRRIITIVDATTITVTGRPVAELAGRVDRALAGLSKPPGGTR